MCGRFGGTIFASFARVRRTFFLSCWLEGRGGEGGEVKGDSELV